MNNIFARRNAPDCDVAYKLHQSLNTCIRKSTQTRIGIVRRMNEALGNETKIVTEQDLNDWLAPSTTSHMPVQYITAFCFAVGFIDPFIVLLEPLLYKPQDQQVEMLKQLEDLKAKRAEIDNLEQSINSTLLG